MALIDIVCCPDSADIPKQPCNSASCIFGLALPSLLSLPSANGGPGGHDGYFRPRNRRSKALVEKTCLPTVCFTAWNSLEPPDYYPAVSLLSNATNTMSQKLTSKTDTVRWVLSCCRPRQESTAELVDAKKLHVKFLAIWIDVALSLTCNNGRLGFWQG